MKRYLYNLLFLFFTMTSFSAFAGSDTPRIKFVDYIPANEIQIIVQKDTNYLGTYKLYFEKNGEIFAEYNPKVGTSLSGDKMWGLKKLLPTDEAALEVHNYIIDNSQLYNGFIFHYAAERESESKLLVIDQIELVKNN